MAKEKIKKALGAKGDLSLIDTHRLVPRMHGGTYTDGNVVLKTPVEHLEEHDNFREREQAIEELKSLFDGYKQQQKLRQKIGNQLLALTRGTDRLSDEDRDHLRVSLKAEFDYEKVIGKRIKKWVKDHQDIKIISAMKSVKGVGEIAIAACMTYFEIAKADHPSSFWAYAGYHKPSHERKIKNSNDKPGNQTLRNAMFVLAGCFIKNPTCAYRKVYDLRKAQQQHSEKITQTRIAGKTGLHEKMWKDVSDGHRHGDAIRVMMKNFLADLWYVWRELEGLPTNDLYVEAHLGHVNGRIDPKFRGWDY